MKDKKQKTWLILQILWILIFVVGAALLEGKYRTLAILCACACVYTLAHGLIRSRTEQKLSEGAVLSEGKSSREDGEKL